MNDENLAHFKQRLHDWLQDLLGQADRTASDLKDFDMPRADLIDKAVEESNRSFNLRIRNRESILIRKIQRSLRDIEEGTYGICEMCGESIGIRRLQARPVARHCIHCKTEMEKGERLRGN